MQEWLDELSQYSTREHEIAVQDESWLIDYYPDNEERTLYGIMPDSGADYALMIWRDVKIVPSSSGRMAIDRCSQCNKSSLTACPQLILSHFVPKALC